MNPPVQIPIMPFVVLALLALPIRLQPDQLRRLAFAIWLVGGLVLMTFGAARLAESEAAISQAAMAGAIAVAVAIGYAKGRFVLAKSSARNLERIQAMTQPQRPIHVYSTRSWIIISLMVLISLSLTWFGAPMLWRGLVNLGVGAALIASSLRYLQAKA